MQIDFFKLGLRRFRRQAARQAIRKYNRASFVVLGANTKGEIRDQFAKLGLNPGKCLDPAEDSIRDVIKHIGVWTCRK